MYQIDKAISEEHRQKENALHKTVYRELQNSGIKVAKTDRWTLCRLCKNAFGAESRRALLNRDTFASTQLAWREWTKALVKEVESTGQKRLRREHIQAVINSRGGLTIG